MSPIDTSIYQTPPSQGFNTPFQTLAQIGAIQQQRQQIASNKALEDERQQALKDAQRKQQEADRFNSIIGNPDLTPEKFLEQVRVSAPEHYFAAQKSIEDAKKAAADLAEKQSQAAHAQAQVQSASQEYVAHLASQVNAHGNTPEAFELAMKLHQQAFPESKTPDELRAYVKQQGPDAIKQLTTALIRSNPQTSTAADTQASTAAKLPGEVADSAVKQQVAAGTTGGITPEQQAQNKNAAGQLAVAQGRLTLEQQKAKDEAAAKVTKAAQGRPLLSSDVNKISDLDKSISELKDLGERLKTGAGMGAMARAEAALVPGGLAPYVPGAEAAKATAADIKLAQQVAGRAVHGGVMRKNDQEQAEQYLPKQDDPPQVVQAKLANILKLANDSKIGHIENLKRGGFDVSGFQSAIGASAPLRKEIPGHPGSFAVSKDDGKTWQAE